VKLLLENGADVNIKGYNGNTLLHQIITKNNAWNSKVIKLMLEYNLDVNQQDIDGNTALHHLLNRKLPICTLQLLLENSALDIERLRYISGINKLVNLREFCPVEIRLVLILFHKNCLVLKY